jgi:hypothetical protein
MEKTHPHIVKHEKCEIGNIILRDDKILMFKPFDGKTTVTVDQAKEMYDVFMDITKGIPHLYYSDNTNMKGIESDARVYVNSKIHHFASALSIKENSAVIRFITHSMVYLNKPKIPIKMFKTEDNAIEWLKSL